MTSEVRQPTRPLRRKGSFHFSTVVLTRDRSIVFEAETDEKDVTARKPCDPRSPLFSRALAAWSLFQGLFAFLLVAAIYVAALRRGMPENEVRALAFVSLVFTNAGLIFTNRFFSASVLVSLRRPDAALWWALGTAAALMALVLTWPPAGRPFHFGPLHLDDLALCGGAGIATLFALDFLKFIWLRRRESAPIGSLR
jgi:P-type Ca2+ transporter type 2C